MAWKHPNVYVGCDAHAPKYWDPSFVRLIGSRRGQDKVLFGTDWSVIGFERAIREIEELGFSDEVKRKLLWENAVRVYALEDWVEMSQRDRTKIERERGPSPFVTGEVPLYYQLGTILREQILSGSYAIGDQLPTEAELVADYGVSRITVRQALKTLEEEKLIRREAGRGTFVTGHPGVPDTIQMEDTLDGLMSIGRATTVRLLDLRRVASTQQDIETFEIDPDELVTQCARLRCHHETPYSYIVNRLPTAIAERFEDKDWRRGSIMRAVEKRLGWHLRVADQSIRATLADAPLAKLLEIRIGAPLLSVDRVVRADGGRAVARVHTYYRGDIYSLNVHLTRDHEDI